MKSRDPISCQNPAGEYSIACKVCIFNGMIMADLRSPRYGLKIKSSAVVSTIVLLIAICSINAWQMVLPNFSYDNSFSIAAAKNINDGKGYSLTSVLPGDLSVTHVEPLNNWPPGYSWLLVIIKKLTGKDWITSCYILNAIGATALILSLRKIMILLQIPAWILNIYLLFAGSVPYPFLSCWFSDLLAAASFMWALALLLRIVVKNKNIFLCSLTAGFLLGCCAWMKYLYLPVCFVPITVLFIYSWKTDKRPILKALAYGNAILVFSIAGMFWFLKKHSGAAFYINPTGRGFFPESLLHLGPIMPSAMIDFPLFDFHLSTLFHIPYLKMIFFWKGLNILLLTGLLFLIIRYYRICGFRLARPLDIYMCIGLAVSITICAELILLSLIQAPYKSRYTAYWTYVEELRYYAVALLFIPQGILFLILYQAHLLSHSRKIFITAVLAIVSIQIIHGIYYLPKQILLKKEVGKNRASEQLDIVAMKTAARLMEHGEKLVVCSDSHEVANLVSLTGVPVLYEYDSLNTSLASSKPLILLVILNERIPSDYKLFKSACHPDFLFRYIPAGDHTGTNFYVVKFPGL